MGARMARPAVTKSTTSGVKAGSVGPLSLDTAWHSGKDDTWDQVPLEFLVPAGDQATRAS